MKNSISADMKWCATCIYWGGYRTPNNWRDHVEYETNQEGLCYKINSRKMPHSCCEKWEQQFKK